MNPPNVLFLMTDQHRWDCLGIHRTEIKTPNLDRLAARGICFDQAVCQNPQCVPSRYSLTTGLYPSQTGVRSNNHAIHRDADMPVPTIFQRLQDAGYLTIGAGKTHWYVPVREGRDIRPIEASTRGFDWRFMGREPNNDDHEPGAVFHFDEDPEALSWMVGYERKVGPNSGGESFEGYMGCEAPFDASRMREHWLTTKAIESIDKAAGAKQPWHVYLSFDFPHAPLAVPREFENLYSLDDIPDVSLPPEGAALERHYNMWHSDEIMEKWTALPERERRTVWRRYYALCSYVDSQFGRILEHLEETGQAGNTFVLFASDHGDSLGERWRFSKYSLYEASVRVPLIIAGKGVEDALKGTTDSRHAELVDLVPSILDAIGKPIPDELPGESLLRPGMRRGAFAEFHSHGYDEVIWAPAYMWRTRKWKLILSFDGNLDQARRNPEKIRGELYNLAEDPMEWKNRYTDPELLPVREELTRDLLYQLAINWSHFPRHESHSWNRPRKAVSPSGGRG
jgi:arylsulfatase A-like enzyme